MQVLSTKWSLNKQAIAIVILTVTLTSFRTLSSPVELQSQFLIELMGWNLVNMVVVLFTAWQLEHRLLRNWFRCNYRKIALTRAVIYLSLSGILALAGMVYFDSLLPGFNNAVLFWSSWIFYALTYFITTIAIEASKLVGKGFTEKLILGKYHTSRKEKRIFLFIDLKESTRLSKELPLEKYSFLIKQFFRDIEMAMEKFDGEIYQYAGDEVIVTWDGHPSNYDKAVLSFIEFQKQMKAKRNDYLDKYGVAPSFKAGLHSGNVIATWVGRMKRELVFQGEVLNITARLTGLAKSLSFPLLMTKQIARNLSNSMKRYILLGGSYSLKDIQLPMEVYFLRPPQNDDPVQNTSSVPKPVAENNFEMLQSN